MRATLFGILTLLSLALSGCMAHSEEDNRKEYTAEVEIYYQNKSDSLNIVRLWVTDAASSDTLTHWMAVFPETGDAPSLFFKAKGYRRFHLHITRADSTALTSGEVVINLWRKNFRATIEAKSIKIQSMDHLFPVKDSTAESRWIFLLLFMFLKVSCALLIYSTGKFPWKVFPSFLGAFLFSVLLTWHVPITNIGLFVLCSWSEGALIFISNRRHISIIKTSMVVTGSNLAAFGLVHLLYSLYFLW